MLTPKQQLDNVFHKIRDTGKYIERDYKTIGGMWTVDRWELELDGTKYVAQLMDEGYTNVVITEGLNVYATAQFDPVFREGDEKKLTEIYQKLNG